jgi:hypothetical protein
LLIEKGILESMEIESLGLDESEVKDYADHLQEVAKNSELVSKHL